MSTASARRPVVDFSLLTTPFKPQEITGPSLKYEPIYGQIREARREEDDTLSQGVWQTEFKRADWLLVEKLCLEVLSSKSKDLQITAWLTEAWTVIDHFKGAERGLTVLIELCKAFWTNLHPSMQENDPESLEQRQSLFEWIDSQLANRIMFIPLTHLENEVSPSSFTLADWLSATNLEMVARRSPDSKNLLTQAENKGQVTLSRFRKSLDLTPGNFLEENLTQVLSLQKKLDDFQEVLQTFLDKNAPTFGKLKKNLDDIVRIIKTSHQQRQKNVPPPEQTSYVNESLEELLNHPEPATPSAPATNPDVVTISERQDAYRALKDISGFLKSLDAHSPAPYLLDLIVSWENKTLVEILADINKGEQEGHMLLKLLANTLQTTSIKSG